MARAPHCCATLLRHTAAPHPPARCLRAPPCRVHPLPPPRGRTPHLRAPTRTPRARAALLCAPLQSRAAGYLALALAMVAWTQAGRNFSYQQFIMALM
ncbi:hypothetical protein EON67_03415 [archaeon]|nr:MAG: hypothetical protein EON67_03415 [archaeon]